MPTLKNVADLAGVSTATVSRTLNNPEQVDPITRSKVSDAIKKTNYKRNEMARSLATQSSRTIGLLTDAFSSSYYGPLLDEITNVLHQQSYYTLVEAMGGTPTRTNIDIQNRAWHSLIGRQVESMILVTGLISDEMLSNMLNEFPASVIIGRKIRHAEDRCVYFDHYAGGQLAAKHLLEKGHRRLAMITGPNYMNDATLRGNGFMDELAANGITLEAGSIFDGDYTVAGGSKAVKKMLQKEQNYTAIFAHNDDMAAGAISEFHSAGINVPSKMSIIGFDDSIVANAVHPPLTSIAQPLKQMSRSAALLALNLSKSQASETSAKPPQLHFLPKLVERQSVSNLQNSSI